MRLPNGYGCVKKLAGNRRRPYAAIITVSMEVKQVQEYIGYYKTKAEALDALSTYNKYPYDLNNKKKTFKDVYELWSKALDEMNENTAHNYKRAYWNSKPLYNISMCDIRLKHLQDIIDAHNDSYDMCRRLATLWNKVFNYAEKNEIISKNYAELVEIPTYKQKTQRGVISKDDIKTLWATSKDVKDEMLSVCADLFLILLYSGTRINEILELKKENVNIKEQYFDVLKSKTISGIRRVPIADAVLPIWNKYMKAQGEYLINTIQGDNLKYSNYQKRYFEPMKKKNNFEFTAHETRHTFISSLVELDTNETVIKIIVGHKSVMSLTEEVYTHISNKKMLEAVNKLHTRYTECK